jgi:hypothetical protein
VFSPHGFAVLVGGSTGGLFNAINFNEQTGAALFNIKTEVYDMKSLTGLYTF